MMSEVRGEGNDREVLSSGVLIEAATAWTTGSRPAEWGTSSWWLRSRIEWFSRG
jgi:hypothetical protein